MIAVNVETIALDRIVVLPVRYGLFRKDVTASRKASESDVLTEGSHLSRVTFSE